MTKMSKPLMIIFVSLSVVVLAVGVLLLSPSVRTTTRIGFETALAHSYSSPKDNFPKPTQEGLSGVQQKIVALSKQEYQKKPVSFDDNVLKYSQGHKEPWCANFVSWIMKGAGVAYSNPNSGSWRIPGVSTLQEYYQSKNRYATAGNYVPKVGDVAIYKKDRSHASIVIGVKGNLMTTVGGNETGHIRISTQSFKQGDVGLSGFGTLKK